MKTPSITHAQNKRSGFTKFALTGLLVSLAVPTVLQAAPVTGNISPFAIEIDPSANLYPSGTVGFVDWVKDSLPNTDQPSLIDSIAVGITPNVTGAVAGKGHWNGVRIVDGIAGADQDIFLTGGKENDTTTWNVGPGSVGSSKYDITQAYLANNQDSLFFGMERRGNNGTTAFDFEFNQAGPSSTYIPTRTVGDVLFTFEMNGSGNSGSAVPHYFIWNGSAYIEKTPAPASLVSSINNTDTPAGPWGYVDSKGNWVLGNLPRFSFAEASVKISEAFPNFVPCSNNGLFVQVRTRSSATDTSDLKDTTKIFQFLFGGPSPVASLTTTCEGQIVYNGSASTDSTGSTNLTYSWSFTPPAGVTLSGAGLTGPNANGTYTSTLRSGTINVSFPAGVESASVSVNLTVTESGSCSASTGPTSFAVFAPLTAAIVQKAMSGANLSVQLTGSASSGATLQWQRLAANGTWVNISGASNSVVTYSSFETDASPAVQNFTIDGQVFSGKLYQVQIRLHAERTIGGLLCSADSSPVTVKKVIAVDP